MTAARRGPAPAPGRPAIAGLLVVVLVAGIFALTQHPGLLTVPFVGDDYFTLDKTRDASFLSIWAPRELVSHFYRPWSRELHYWTLQRLFGDRVAPWHAVSLLLWSGVLGLYFALALRLAGRRVAVLATAGAMAMAGWGLLLVWSQGAQDLWMMLFALLAMHATLRDRPGWACAAQLLALLSKETAALLPGILFGLEWLALRRRPAEALRRTLPMLVVALGWASLHPLLGGRLWWPRHDAMVAGLHPAASRIASRTLLAVLNLNVWPRPEDGWRAALGVAIPGALALCVLLAWGTWRAGRERVTPGTPARVAAFGALWALLAWLPLLMPTIGLYAYRNLAGAMGAWLALAVVLARVRRGAWVVLVAVVVLGAGVATTPSAEWGTEWFQRRAAAFSDEAREAIRGLRATLPAHSRVFFCGPLGGSGIVPGGEESAALRFWYRDRTLRAATWDRFVVRAREDSLGEDVFLRYDHRWGWREVVRGWVDAHSPRAALERWREDHERLAVTLAEGRDWSDAFEEYAKLAGMFPDSATYPYCAGLVQDARGDRVGARRWLQIAAALPGAGEEIHTAQRRLSGER